MPQHTVRGVHPRALLDDAGREMEKSVNDVINMASIIKGIRNSGST